ncbi:MAG TPA: hypothetical protein ENI29_10575 [bacterium]|nr:hypothetical protein [bacterium]
MKSLYSIEKNRLNNNFLDKFKVYNFSLIKETKIFLVGSTRFKDYFIKIESILQINHDKLASICSIDGLLNKEKSSTTEWKKLQEIALKKLIHQEAILVIDVENYIGDHSKEEIKYFINSLQRPVYYLSDLKMVG